MHSETLAPDTERVLRTLAGSPLLADFYLAGGTALALQFGHRLSVDLDFFSQKDFTLADAKKALVSLGAYTLENEEPGTLDGELDGVKLTLLRYEYPLLFPFVDFGGVRLADPRDIACMKLDAISSRGSKKDFIDLFVILEKYQLRDIFDLFDKKYAGIAYNRLHLLKSLSYFADAEEEPMPRMLRELSWETVMETIANEARKVLFQHGT